jgi:hypothetical protein
MVVMLDTPEPRESTDSASDPPGTDPWAVDAQRTSTGPDDGDRRPAATVRSWAHRSGRDRRSRVRLDIDADDGMVVLKDRRVPGSRVNIKMIVVAPAGVFVIDTKPFKGLVHTKRLGPMSALGPDQLHVGRKDCTPHVHAVSGQVGSVRQALATKPWATEVPVHAMLCLTRAEWGFASAIEVDDVWVGWPTLLPARMHAAAVMDSLTVREVSAMIADHLPTI